MSDDHLGNKVLDICRAMNLTVENSDIEGCHRIGKVNPKTAIVKFVNRKFCNLILDKKHELKKLNAKLCFQNNVTLFVSENLSPFNQRLLAWKCRELRRTSKTQSSFSSKGIVKICCTMNEHISTEHDRDLASFYLDFVF